MTDPVNHKDAPTTEKPQVAPGAQKPVLPAALMEALENTRNALHDQNDRIVKLRRVLFNIMANGRHDQRCDALANTCAPLCARRMAKDGLK